LRLSVIVPVLNEATTICAFLFDLREQLSDAEVLIIDGGSDDGTWTALEALREKLSLRILRAKRGRAAQMNAGAKLATGDVFLFLHADSRLPAGCDRAIATLLANERVTGGCFRLSFPRPEWIYRVSDSLGNVAVDLFRIALGDHGIFCRREAFLRAGGYPAIPLMEDAEFYRALRRCGRVRQLRAEVETSPRRYEELGRYRTTFFYLLILTLYVSGVNPHRLASWHRQFTRRTGTEPLIAAPPSRLWGEMPVLRSR
jgi:rSAM/selenodomain-associated transferase 2